MLRDCDGREIRDWPSPEVRRRLAALDRERPTQVPLEPKAGFLAVVEGAKPDKVGERMAACLAKADRTWRERVMLAVVAYHDGDGGAFPSQERLADMLDMRVSRVNEAIRDLGAKGPLQWEARHGSARAPNLYKITCGEPFESGGRIPRRAESGERIPLSAKTASHLPQNAEPNRNNRGAASRQGHQEENSTDLCDPPGDCRIAAFVPVGGRVHPVRLATKRRGTITPITILITYEAQLPAAGGRWQGFRRLRDYLAGRSDRRFALSNYPPTAIDHHVRPQAELRT